MLEHVQLSCVFVERRKEERWSTPPELPQYLLPVVCRRRSQRSFWCLVLFVPSRVANCCLSHYWSDDVDGGTSCHTISTRSDFVGSPRSNWTCRSSARHNTLAAAQTGKDTPSVMGVECLGRPKEFTGKEEDFQQWSEKLDAFLGGGDQGVRDDAWVVS